MSPRSPFGPGIGPLARAFALSALASLPAQRARAVPPAPVAVARDYLVLLSDGKNHYVAVLPFSREEHRLFYSGDGKTFHDVHVSTSGSEEGKFDYVFDDPRYYLHFTQMSSLEWNQGVYQVTCGTRTVPLAAVPRADAKPLVDRAAFLPSPRERAAYALVRDQSGSYYYVDHGREPRTEKSFRLFAGPKGNLKQLKMTNVVSDSEGDIFATRTGSLRLVLDKKESLWVDRGKPTKLTLLPIDDNLALIYNDLGVYAGARLGTLCDDL